MGQASSAFKEEPVGVGKVTGKLGKCISPAFVSTKPMKLALNNGSVVDSETDTVLFETKAKMGFGKLTVTVTSPSGELICVAYGKDGFSSSTVRFLKPTPAYQGQGEAAEKTEAGGKLYSFAKADISKSFASAKAVYSFTKADEDGDSIMVPLYTGEKLKGMALMIRVENQDGTLVAKQAQPGFDSRKQVAEVGKNVDIIAVTLLGSFIGAASGSGGAAVGGLAGAGAI